MFLDRKDAGLQLADKLFAYKNKPDTVVLALPRGGVPVASEIAKELQLPLDIFLVRKIGVPGSEETAMGALASGGISLLNESLIEYLNITQEAVQTAIAKEQAELEHREKIYRENRPTLNLRGCSIILVDDGMATGASMQVAVMALKKMWVKEIIVAVPVTSDSANEELSAQATQVISLLVPRNFQAVGEYYRDFTQTTHEEVKALLKEASQRKYERRFDSYN